MPHPIELSSVLNGVKGMARVSVKDWQRKGEWFCVRSRILTEPELFARLEREWRALVGQHHNKFALLHVSSGRDKGVWIHHFPSEKVASEYEPGCHRLPSWF